MKELLHLFRLVTVSESTPYCVLCLRTDTRRKLIENNSLNRILSCLNDEEVWPWKHSEDKNMKVCYICEARLVSAMRVIELVRSGVMVDRLLQCYKKKQLLHPSGQMREHPFRHAMWTCNARFKAATSASNLFLTEALAINIKSEAAAAEPTDMKTSAPKKQEKPKSQPDSLLKAQLNKKTEISKNTTVRPTSIGLTSTDTNSNNTGLISQDPSNIKVTAGPCPATNYPVPSTQQNNPVNIKVTEKLSLINTGKFLALKTPGESVVLHAIYQGTDSKSYVPTLNVMIQGGQLLPMPDFGINKLPPAISTLPNMGISLPGLENILSGTTLDTKTNASIPDTAGINASIQGNAGINESIQGNAGINASIQSNAGIIASIQSNAGKNASIQGNAGINTSIQSNAGINASIQGNAGKNASIQSNAGINALIQCNAGVKAVGVQTKPQPKLTIVPPSLAHKLKKPTPHQYSRKNTIELNLKNNNLNNIRTYSRPERITNSPPNFDDIDDPFDSLPVDATPDNDLSNFDAEKQLPCFETEVELPNENLIDVLEETAMSMEDDPLEQVDQVAVPGPVSIKTEQDADVTQDITEDGTNLQNDSDDTKLFPNQMQLSNQLTNTEIALIRLDIMNNYKQPIVPLIPCQIKNKQKNTITNRKPTKLIQLTHPLITTKFNTKNTYMMQLNSNKDLQSKRKKFIDSQLEKTKAIRNTTVQANKKIKPKLYSVQDEVSHSIDRDSVDVVKREHMTVVVSDSDTEEDSMSTIPVQNVIKTPIMKDGYSMDWEDKIPMDVITYMDATDPSVVPKPDESFQQPNTDGGGALGVIIDAYSERDVVCIDLDE